MEVWMTANQITQQHWIHLICGPTGWMKGHELQPRLTGVTNGIPLRKLPVHPRFERPFKPGAMTNTRCWFSKVRIEGLRYVPLNRNGMAPKIVANSQLNPTTAIASLRNNLPWAPRPNHNSAAPTTKQIIELYTRPRNPSASNRCVMIGFVSMITNSRIAPD